MVVKFLGSRQLTRPFPLIRIESTQLEHRVSYLACSFSYKAFITHSGSISAACAIPRSSSDGMWNQSESITMVGDWMAFCI